MITQHRAAPRSTTQHYAAQRSTTQHYAALRSTHSTTQHHAAPRSTTQHHAAPRSITQHHTVPRSTTQHNAAPHNNTGDFSMLFSPFYSPPCCLKLLDQCSSLCSHFFATNLWLSWNVHVFISEMQYPLKIAGRYYPFQITLLLFSSHSFSPHVHLRHIVTEACMVR